MAKIRELRSAIFLNYDHEADLAHDLGWPRQRLNKITNGEKVPDITELSDLSKALNIPIEIMAQFFLHK